jgi:hypothetical protein
MPKQKKRNWRWRIFKDPVPDGDGRHWRVQLIFDVAEPAMHAHTYSQAACISVVYHYERWLSTHKNWKSKQAALYRTVFTERRHWR